MTTPKQMEPNVNNALGNLLKGMTAHLHSPGREYSARIPHLAQTMRVNRQLAFLVVT